MRSIILFLLLINVFFVKAQTDCYKSSENRIIALLKNGDCDGAQIILNKLRYCDDRPADFETKRQNIQANIITCKTTKIKLKDSDGDGFPDSIDICPKEYSKTCNGCPDKDNDGFSDRIDQCPDKYSKENNGCPVVKLKNGNYQNIRFVDGMYSGAFKNNERSGKGKMYYDNGDKYDGDWENDKKSGNGKMIYYTDLSVYDGEWKENKTIWGKYYKADSSIIYEGEYKNNLAHGWGKLISGKDIFEGEFSEGNKKGWGTYTWANGNKYTGQWENNKCNGFGICIITDPVHTLIPNCPNAKTYCGYWRNNQQEGFGRCYDKDNRLIYEGTFQNDKPTGSPYPNFFPVDKNKNLVYQLYNDGSYCNAQFKGSARNGYGILQYGGNAIEKYKYEGEYKNDQRYGWGVYTWQIRGDIYEGGFKNDKKDGWGKFTFKDEGFYEGEFRDDLIEGFGRFILEDDKYFNGYDNSAKYYYGNFKNNKFEGFGRMYNKDRRLVYEGQFKENKMADK